jgi:hypothetical protein
MNAWDYTFELKGLPAAIFTVDYVQLHVKLHLVKTVSVLEFRRHLPKIVKSLQTGKEAIRLTYRGKPLADLTPVRPKATRPADDDPFYRICELAVEGLGLSNKEMDEVLYAKPTGVR